jgi:hypothetical protein
MHFNKRTTLVPPLSYKWRYSVSVTCITHMHEKQQQASWKASIQPDDPVIESNGKHRRAKKLWIGLSEIPDHALNGAGHN